MKKSAFIALALQAKITEEALRELDKVHHESAFEENAEDMFWA